MNGIRDVSRRTAIIIAVAAGLIVLAAGAAFTASFTISAQKLGTGATGTPGCNSNAITVDIPTLVWSVGSSPGTTVVEYRLQNVDSTCNGKFWKATLGSVTNPVCIAQGSGNLTVASNTATIALSSDGCTIPAPPSATLGVGSLTVTVYD